MDECYQLWDLEYQHYLDEIHGEDGLLKAHLCYKGILINLVI